MIEGNCLLHRHGICCMIRVKVKQSLGIEGLFNMKEKEC